MTPPAKQELDFIVIGAQKSATTTLFQYLRQHPQVALPTGKEVPYFSHDGMYSRGWQAYMEGLAEDPGMADAGRRWGTITPHYMAGGVLNPARGEAARSYDEGTIPRRIHEQLPDVRLIAILRDPVERARSHHAMIVRMGGERRSFDEAVAQLLEPDALREGRERPRETNGYVVRGEYGRILDSYLEVFPRERLLVLFTDELESEPHDLLARLHRFIDVDEDFVPPNLGERYLVGKPQRGFAWRRPATWLSPSSPVSPQGLARGVRRLPAARALFHAVPFERQRRLLRPYERVAGRAVAFNRRRAAIPDEAIPPPSPETVARLREHYADDAERLAGLLGGVAPYWAREQART